MKIKPSEALHQHREAIRKILEENDVCNPRVFGSVVHGDDPLDGDLDLLVNPIKGITTLVSLGRIKRAIDTLAGVHVDVLTPNALHERFRAEVLREAVPL